jgi:hypothetical protein
MLAMRPPARAALPAVRRGAGHVLRVAAVAALLAGAAGAEPADRLLPLARAIVREQPGMWAQASVARGERVVVVGGPRELVARLATLADQASRTVARVWGRPAEAVILVPATDGQAATLAAPAPVEGLAALAGADRVIVEPSGFARLTEAGRRVVMTHELTHVATGAATTGTVPAWLSEGFADYVGYLGTGLPVATVAAELAKDARAGSLPGALPERGDFRARPAQAYEGAWLACRYIAERYGEHALVRLYRAALRTGAGPALEATLGITLPELTRAWRGYVHDKLAAPDR